MNEFEQKYLETLISRGKKLMWSPDESTCRLITSITTRKDEFGLCAYFENGEYLALIGCEMSDFIVGERLIMR